MKDEFYIGYEPAMPPGLARRSRAAAVVLVTFAVLLPAVLLAAHRRAAAAVFEFGTVRTYEGRLVEFPYPAIEVNGAHQPSGGFYWLVGPGKHGAAPLVRGLDGRMVRVRGTRIERDGDAMLQVEPDGVELAPGGDIRPVVTPTARIRTVRFVGEIVDGKCHLGVMKPGEGPTHRDCAVRCLLGNIVPFVVVHGASDLPRRVALLDEHDQPFTIDLAALAGRPVAIEGVLVSQRARMFVSARAQDIEPLR